MNLFSWGRCPQPPRDLPHSCQNDGARRQIARPPLIPATESALGLRPRSALSSAQVLPEWITSTSPCNDLSANGDNPLTRCLTPGVQSSLETPLKIRMLQRKLYQKAKEEPNYRFYLLYDKMYREDILNHAYALTKFNQGAPGVDGQSFAGIEAAGLGEWLNGIRNDLRAKTYTPQAVRRVKIPKPGGGERPLGIPTCLLYTSRCV